jgi:hypothetical protein
MIVGVGITHFANQADTLILIYLFAERTAPYQNIEKIVRSLWLLKVRSHFFEQ